MRLYYKCKECENNIYFESVINGVLIKIDGLEITCENCGAEYTIYLISSKDEDDNNNGFGHDKQRGSEMKSEDKKWPVLDPNFIDIVSRQNPDLSSSLIKQIKVIKVPESIEGELKEENL